MTYEPTSALTRDTAGRRVATAFFDNRETAEQARQDLVAAGFAPDAISLAGRDAAAGRPAEDDPVLPEQGGFWHALKEFFMPDQDRYTYAEGLRRGGFVLSVTTEAADYDRALDILDADGAVDIDERERNWLAEGWSGWQPGGEPFLSVPPDNSTAGFGASLAGEDGFQPPQPRDAVTGGLTRSGDADAESRADPTRVGTGAAAPGTLNPDMRERIGSGTASMTPPTPTGPQDATLRDNAAALDRKAAVEDASLGSPTREGLEEPAGSSTVGSTAPEADAWTSRRDDDVRRARVRGFIVDSK